MSKSKPEKKSFFAAVKEAIAASNSNPVTQYPIGPGWDVIRADKVNIAIDSKNQPIVLPVPFIGDGLGKTVERAIRSIVNDTRTDRDPDVLIDGKEVEVKYRQKKSDSYRTDSRAHVINPNARSDKYYLYLTGTDPTSLDAFLINADDMYAVRKSLLVGENTGIEPNKAAIADLIRSKADDLAAAIEAKFSGKHDGEASLSLGLIGVDKVRFDVKFEQLIRKTVREILKS